MKLSRRTNTIILWLISIGLLVSMVIAFTPTLGGLFNRTATGADTSAPALLVNGQTITELDIARARQNPPFNFGLEGEAGADLELLLLDSLVRNAVFRQAATTIQVSNNEVRDAVNEFRQAQNVAGSRNDQAYLALIGRAGFTDSSFRAFLRDQLRQERYQEQLVASVTVTDEEVLAFYELNTDLYQSEERILARQIVLDNQQTAQDVYARALAGEDFAELAREFSVERADRDGALGAPSGSTEPQPVGRAALPTQVANAAFGLQGAGMTELITVGERFHIVQVEEFIPAGTRPFEEVAEQVREDALAVKQNAVIEQRINELLASAEITVPAGSPYSFENPVVATVGDTEIRAAELVRETYLSPNIQQALNPQTAELVASLFKPSILEQLIDRELAYQGAQQLDRQFIGSKDQVVISALNYVSRDASFTEEELTEYYDANIDRFTTPASAVMTRVDFDTLEQAMAFRQAMLDGAEMLDAVETTGGSLRDLGTVRPGSVQAELDTAIFGTDAFTPLPESEDEISDVLVLIETVPLTDDANEALSQEDADAETEAADADALETAAADETDASEVTEATRETYVVLLGVRTLERVRPLSEVRAQVEAAVLQANRNELQSAWLDSLRETVTISNRLDEARTEIIETFETTPLPEPLDTTDDATVIELQDGDADATAEAAEAPADVSDEEGDDETPEGAEPTSQDAPETLEAAETLAFELTAQLRDLANRTDLSAEQQAELEALQNRLSDVQQQVASLTGASSTYTVQPGDTLSTIASSYYGTSANWEAILEANSYLIDDPDLIFPGFVLLMPELEAASE
jgi:parvulin-like peptidyl-prolyl isomerase/nucleoid-associated protein YgaU